MLVEFGTARAPTHGFRFRYLHHEPLGNLAEAIDSASDMPGLNCRLTRSVPSVERRQKRARQQDRTDAREHDTGADHRHHRAYVRECPVEEPAIAGLELAHDEGVGLVVARGLGEKVIREHRRQSDRGGQGRHDRNDVGNAQRREQAPFDAERAKSGTKTSTMINVA